MEIIREYYIPILPTPALRINTNDNGGKGTWMLNKDDDYLRNFDAKKKENGKEGYAFRRKKSLEKYFGFKDELAFWFKKNKITPPYKNFSVQFNLPIGKSIRKKIAFERIGKDHEFRPDVDNLNKAYLDAFNKRSTMLWFDYKDCITNRIFISKVWCLSGKEGIRVREYDYLDL